MADFISVTDVPTEMSKKLFHVQRLRSRKASHAPIITTTLLALKNAGRLVRVEKLTKVNANSTRNVRLTSSPERTTVFANRFDETRSGIAPAAPIPQMMMGNPSALVSIMSPANVCRYANPERARLLSDSVWRRVNRRFFRLRAL